MYMFGVVAKNGLRSEKLLFKRLTKNNQLKEFKNLAKKIILLKFKKNAFIEVGSKFWGKHD